AGLHEVARDRNALAVHVHVAMADELARREHGGRELRAINDCVETALEQSDHVLARVAFLAARFRIVLAELLLADVAVIALELLLRLELRAEVRELAFALRAVLAGRRLAIVERALRAAPEVLAETA